MIKATALHDLVKTESAVDLKKLAKLEAGDVVSTLAGPVYRVISKMASSGKTSFRFANLAGQPVDLTVEKLAAMVPLSPLFVRLAARFRFCASQKFSEIIHAALQEAGMPIDPQMNWDAWFKRVYLDRLYSNSKVHDKDLIKEAARDVIMIELFDRRALSKYDSTKVEKNANLPEEQKISKYLISLFTNRYSDAVDRLKRYSGAIDTPSGLSFKCKHCGKKFNHSGKESTAACPKCAPKPTKEVPNPVQCTECKGESERTHDDVESTSMFEKGVGDEGDTEDRNILESLPGQSVDPDVEENDSWEDITRFAKLFSGWLDKNTKPKQASHLKILFSLMLQDAQEDTTNSRSKRNMYADEWMQQTGLSHDSFKVNINVLLAKLEQFVDENPEFENNYAFVKMLRQTLNKKRKDEKSEAPVSEEPKKSSIHSLNLAAAEHVAAMDPYANQQVGPNNPNPQQMTPEQEQMQDQSKMPSTRTQSPMPQRTVPPEIPGQGGMVTGSDELVDDWCGSCLGEDPQMSNCQECKGTGVNPARKVHSSSFSDTMREAADHVVSEDINAAEYGQHGTEENFMALSDVEEALRAGNEEYDLHHAPKTSSSDLNESLDINGHSYNLTTFQERDRFNISFTDESTGQELLNLWDEDAQTFVEDGFFNWKDPVQSCYEYCQDMGMIKGQDSHTSAAPKNHHTFVPHKDQNQNQNCQHYGMKYDAPLHGNAPIKAEASATKTSAGGDAQIVELFNLIKAVEDTKREVADAYSAVRFYKQRYFKSMQPHNKDLYLKAQKEQADAKAKGPELRNQIKTLSGAKADDFGQFVLTDSRKGATSDNYKTYTGPSGAKLQISRIFGGGKITGVASSTIIKFTPTGGEEVEAKMESGYEFVKVHFGELKDQQGQHMYVSSLQKTARTEVQEDLLDKKEAEECPKCGAVSAYSWDDVNFCDNCTEPFGEDIPEPDRIYHIGATSSFEWQCGKCRNSWTEHDSPINAEVYTHNSSEEKTSGAMTLPEIFTSRGWAEYYSDSDEDEESDVVTFKKGPFQAWYSQDEGAWGITRRGRAIAEGELHDNSLTVALDKLK